jgi:hypothetical protein
MGSKKFLKERQGLGLYLFGYNLHYIGVRARHPRPPRPAQAGPVVRPVGSTEPDSKAKKWPDATVVCGRE